MQVLVDSLDEAEADVALQRQRGEALRLRLMGEGRARSQLAHQLHATVHCLADSTTLLGPMVAEQQSVHATALAALEHDASHAAADTMEDTGPVATFDGGLGVSPP